MVLIPGGGGMMESQPQANYRYVSAYLFSKGIELPPRDCLEFVPYTTPC